MLKIKICFRFFFFFGGGDEWGSNLIDWIVLFNVNFKLLITIFLFHHNFFLKLSYSTSLYLESGFIFVPFDISSLPPTPPSAFFLFWLINFSAGFFWIIFSQSFYIPERLFLVLLLCFGFVLMCDFVGRFLVSKFFSHCPCFGQACSAIFYEVMIEKYQ